MSVLILCVQIFFFRIIDVSLGTVRTILMVRGKSAAAAITGFAEVFIWFLIVNSALSSEESGIFVALAFAGGFAAGTYLGSVLANRFITGMLNVQVITSSRDDGIITAIRDAGFAVSVLNVNGSQYGAEKYMLVIEIKNNNFSRLEKILYEKDPGAFIMARETKFIQNGFFKY